MGLAEFYEAVLPPTGNYCLFEKKTKKHIWFKTQQELVAGTEARIDGEEVYFATASFIGNRRLQENCAGKKCLYLDIDAGDEKYGRNPKTAWPTTADAARALVGFTDTFGLRPSYVVLSGHGLHVYWVLDETLSKQNWQELADRFKKLTAGAGLRGDPSCTSDSARILRPPGTRHWSGERVKLTGRGRVYSTHAFMAALAAMEALAPQATAADDVMAEFPEVPAHPAYDLSINDDLKPSFDPIPTSGEKIIVECAAMRECAELRGNVAEPLWRGVLGVLKHCVDGPELAHKWSEGHPNYTYLETQDKFERYNAGPTTCETFDSNSDKCRACKHFGKIKSPIVLGRITVEERQESPKLDAAVKDAMAAVPEKASVPISGAPDEVFGAYRREMRGGKLTLVGPLVKKVKVDGGIVEQTIWVPFTHDIFWVTDWTEGGQRDNEGSTLSLSLLRNGKILYFQVQTDASSDRRTLLKYLTSKSIVPLNYEAETTAMMQQYVNDQIKRIKEAASRPVIRDRLGLHMAANGDLYTAYGNVVLYKDGTIQKADLGHHLSHLNNAVILESLPETDGSTWGPSAWASVAQAAKRQAKFYTEWFGAPDSHVAQLAIMLQIASPLLLFAADELLPEGQLPSIGITVSLYSSESAKGKTAMQLAANYAFGNAANLLRQGDRNGMTFNAQIATAAGLGTFPFPMDEVTANDKQQVADSINRMSSGIEKGRAQRDGTVAAAPLRWALISTVSTNIPQRELVAAHQTSSDALQMRLIELNCDLLPTRSLDIVPKYEAALEAAMSGTKGSLGAVLHYAIMRLGYKTVRQMIKEKKDEIVSWTPGESKERFILRGFAAMLVCQDLLVRMGIAMFSTDVLVEQVKASFASTRTFSVNNTREVGDNFLRMVMDLSPRFLITREDLDAGTAMLENTLPVGKVPTGRVCRATNTLYIVVAEIQAWAAENGISFDNIIRDGLRSGMLPDKEPRRLALGKGIRGAFSAKQNVIVANAAAIRGPESELPAGVTPLHRPAPDAEGEAPPLGESRPRRVSGGA